MWEGVRSSLSRGQVVPADSAMDPLQDTAEPMSKAGGTSVKTCARKGRKCWTGRKEREEEEKEEEEEEGEEEEERT